MDVLTPEQRKKCMSSVKSKNTHPEITLRRALWNAGFRYRLHYKIKGKPDLVFVRKKVAVFVDGCFWHGCSEHKTIPKTNRAFWEDKIQKNIERDTKVTMELESSGWKVLRFWEHEILKKLPSVVEKVVSTLKS